MEDFLKESKSFAGITFQGLYTMPTDDFIIMYDYYKKTGINLLDDYSSVKHLEWGKDSETYYEISDINNFENSQSRLSHSRLFNSDWLADIREIIRNKNDSYYRAVERSQSEPRLKASYHISKKEVRLAVFKKHGKRCLCCGSLKNITIDHIIPVSLNGVNSIENYQPLCKSCNSKKGTNIIDYRYGRR